MARWGHPLVTHNLLTCPARGSRHPTWRARRALRCHRQAYAAVDPWRGPQPHAPRKGAVPLPAARRPLAEWLTVAARRHRHGRYAPPMRVLRRVPPPFILPTTRVSEVADGVQMGG